MFLHHLNKHQEIERRLQKFAWEYYVIIALHSSPEMVSWGVLVVEAHFHIHEKKGIHKAEEMEEV